MIFGLNISKEKLYACIRWTVTLAFVFRGSSPMMSAKIGVCGPPLPPYQPKSETGLPPSLLSYKIIILKIFKVVKWKKNKSWHKNWGQNMPILHVYSDLVIMIRKCLAHNTPFQKKKNPEIAWTSLLPLVKKSKFGWLLPLPIPWWLISFVNIPLLSWSSSVHSS